MQCFPAQSFWVMGHSHVLSFVVLAVLAGNAAAQATCNIGDLLQALRRMAAPPVPKLFDQDVAQKYVERHELHTMMGVLLSELVHATPDDPLTFLIDHFTKIEQQNFMSTINVGLKLVKKANRRGLGSHMQSTEAGESDEVVRAATRIQAIARGRASRAAGFRARENVGS